MHFELQGPLSRKTARTIWDEVWTETEECAVQNIFKDVVINREMEINKNIIILAYADDIKNEVISIVEKLIDSRSKIGCEIMWDGAQYSLKQREALIYNTYFPQNIFVKYMKVGIKSIWRIW